MAIQAYTDIGTIIVVLVVMFVIDAFAYITGRGLYSVFAGVLGLYTLGWTFNNGFVVYQLVYSPNLGQTSFTMYKADPNIAVVILSIVTLFSFMYVYFEYEEDK